MGVSTGGDESIEASLGTNPSDISLVLDSSGYPVFAYGGAYNPKNLCVKHCDDEYCSGGGDVGGCYDSGYGILFI